MDDVIKNYPHKDDRGSNRYVKYPIFHNGKWRATDLVKGCCMIPIWAGGFDTQEECQKACDIENKYWDYTPADVERIVSWSMYNK